MHAVDALGLWEYLSDDQARRFAERMYELVMPGGSLIVSNMLDTRPQREFNRRAIGWPDLHLRSDEDMLRIFESAGIDIGEVTLTHADVDVYVVAEVRRS